MATLILDIALLVLCFLVCAIDIFKREIYNLYTVLLFLVALIYNIHSPLDIMFSLSVCIVISILLFIFSIWSGGDSKLLIALTPFFAPEQLLDFYVATLFSGGVLSLIYIVKYRVILNKSIESGLPYGVAIIFGAHLSLYFSQGLTIYS
ncbi:prepilin peptidase [Vibrio sp. B1Z05]|uniref:A24 family peptidase n=1 Tax=Vibrio sp. B1Z05 TaxID=2654980 RepID=UPI00128C8C62|nr:prepilin peptidase [Vibrio sp. B1Z05]MPW35373.1 hypothetical protein [Vibrio sp. B1Z05]